MSCFYIIIKLVGFWYIIWQNYEKLKPVSEQEGLQIAVANIKPKIWQGVYVDILYTSRAKRSDKV